MTSVEMKDLLGLVKHSTATHHVRGAVEQQRFWNRVEEAAAQFR